MKKFIALAILGIFAACSDQCSSDRVEQDTACEVDSSDTATATDVAE